MIKKINTASVFAVLFGSFGLAGYIDLQIEGVKSNPTIAAINFLVGILGFLLTYGRSEERAKDHCIRKYHDASYPSYIDIR